MKLARLLTCTAVLATSACGALGANQNAKALATVSGQDFAGGAKDVFGAAKQGEGETNYVYAIPTGSHASMATTFTLSSLLPAEPLFLHMKACDDDASSQTAIAIELNGKTLFEGTSEFPNAKWQTRKYAIPSGTLKAGENVLTISSREKHGKLGVPPWFMVAACAVAPGEYAIQPDIHKQFHVTLPQEVRPFPEPLAEGQQPGFAIRGTKGWLWSPEQYQAEIPVLAKYKMNFLMNCYGSMCDIEHYKWGDSRINRWWEGLPQAKMKAYEEVVRSCQKNNIQFCFGMNPNICSKRILNYDSPEDINQLFKHYAWMQGLGVKWFNISLDDITNGINASGQAKAVNEIYRRLREKDKEAKMIFCPTFYWGDGTGKEQQPYLETLARELDKDVYLFWTGDAVVGPITRKGADTFRRISGHRVILWDNYPVNDGHPAMHLGPVIDRDPDLCQVCEGYMGNPHYTQNEINCIPLLTCADYAYNPTAYDPMRSVGQAIVHLAETAEQREMLRDLVEAYPGMLLFGKPNTGLNCVRETYAAIARMPHSRQAVGAYVDYVERLAQRMKRVFPTSYAPEKKTLDDDVAYLQKAYAEQFGK